MKQHEQNTWKIEKAAQYLKVMKESYEHITTKFVEISKKHDVENNQVDFDLMIGSMENAFERLIDHWTVKYEWITTLVKPTAAQVKISSALAKKYLDFKELLNIETFKTTFMTD